MSCGKYNTAYWRDLLVQLAGDLGGDVDRLSAWIDEESGGCPSALGASYEVGIFQLDLEDGPAWGGTLDTLHGAFSASPTSQQLTRELTYDEEQLQVTSGLEFVRYAHQRALDNLESIGQTWDDDDTWCLTKLYHALPRLTDNYLEAANAAGHASSWSDYKSWLLGLSRSDAAAVNSAVAAHYFPFGKFVDNAEAVGYADSSVLGVIPVGSGTVDLLLLLALAAAAVLLTRAL